MMNSSAPLAVVCAFLIGNVVAYAQDASGHYEGLLSLPDRELKLAVDLLKDEKQAWTGHLSFVGGPQNLPLKNVTVESEKVVFDLTNFPGGPKFNGKLDAKAGTIIGTATAGDKPADFNLKRTGEAKSIVVKPSTPLTTDFEGRWEGALEVGKTLRLVLTLQNQDGRGTGTLVSVDQGNVSIPLTSITQSGSKIDFEVNMVGGHYSGTLSDAKDQIAGDWTQGQAMPLTFKRVKPAPAK